MIATRCRACGCDLNDRHVRLFGRSCHDCRRRSQETACCQDYLERIVGSGNAAAIEDAVGTLEDLLVRHGIAWN